RFEGDDSFHMLLDKVKATVFAGLEHQDYPFDELVESLSLATDLSRNPLFDVMVILQNADIGNNQSVEGMQGLNFSSSDAAFLGSV
ncbi:condensation domain-containing protein, partial [Chryseobacterium sp. JV558]|uniref:condensation domain-containing protein n=1 Tax=Chryseobacterium sp. JV558 TaxID=2663236 RepID=UPI00299E912F